MKREKLSKTARRPQVGQVVRGSGKSPKGLFPADSAEVGHAGEGFPRFVFVDAATGVVTLQVADALACTSVSVRRLSNELLGALVRAALLHADGREWFTACALACDGDDALLAELRAYMRETHDAAVEIGERLRVLRSGAAA